MRRKYLSQVRNTFFIEHRLTISAGFVFATNLGISGPKGLAIFYNQCELENRVKQDGIIIINFKMVKFWQ